MSECDADGYRAHRVRAYAPCVHIDVRAHSSQCSTQIRNNANVRVIRERALSVFDTRLQHIEYIMRVCIESVNLTGASSRPSKNITNDRAMQTMRLFKQISVPVALGAAQKNENVPDFVYVNTTFFFFFSFHPCRMFVLSCRPECHFCPTAPVAHRSITYGLTIAHSR